MIRKATLLDLDIIYDIINEAKKFMRKNNNYQWNDDYPSFSLLKNEIDDIYVKVIDDEVVGCISIKHYIESYYNYIEGSFLLDTDNYLTLHRLAVREKCHGLGIAKELINFSFLLAKEKNVDSVRADTKETNKIMNNLFIKCGFTYCGKVFVDDITLLAYEKIV